MRTKKKIENRIKVLETTIDTLQGDIKYLTKEIKQLKCDHSEVILKEEWYGGLFSHTSYQKVCKKCGKVLRDYFLEEFLKDKLEHSKEECKKKQKEISEQILRVQNGYPPPHCDADGDFREEE